MGIGWQCEETLTTRSDPGHAILGHDTLLIGRELELYSHRLVWPSYYPKQDLCFLV